MRLGVVVLAAGRSRRMGRPKLLLPWGRTSILGHLLQQWRGLQAEQFGVVCARGDAALATELDRLSFPAKERIFNEAPEQGMFSSVQTAARWPGWNASLSHWAVVLGDQPQLRHETLQALLDFSAAQPERVCQPQRRGHGRHPVILPRTVFAALAQSSCADLKEFLATLEPPVAHCEMDAPELDMDIDTPEDYAKALAVTWNNTP